MGALAMPAGRVPVPGGRGEPGPGVSGSCLSVTTVSRRPLLHSGAAPRAAWRRSVGFAPCLAPANEESPTNGRRWGGRAADPQQCGCLRRHPCVQRWHHRGASSRGPPAWPRGSPPPQDTAPPAPGALRSNRLKERAGGAPASQDAPSGATRNPGSEMTPPPLLAARAPRTRAPGAVPPARLPFPEHRGDVCSWKRGCQSELQLLLPHGGERILHTLL